MIQRVPIGQLLVETNVLTTRQLEETLATQKREGGRVCTVALRLGFADERVVGGGEGHAAGLARLGRGRGGEPEEAGAQRVGGSCATLPGGPLAPSRLGALKVEFITGGRAAERSCPAAGLPYAVEPWFRRGFTWAS